MQRVAYVRTRQSSRTYALIAICSQNHASIIFHEREVLCGERLHSLLWHAYPYAASIITLRPNLRTVSSLVSYNKPQGEPRRR